jgi:hypothetical protein
MTNVINQKKASAKKLNSGVLETGLKSTGKKPVTENKVQDNIEKKESKIDHKSDADGLDTKQTKNNKTSVNIKSKPSSGKEADIKDNQSAVSDDKSFVKTDIKDVIDEQKDIEKSKNEEIQPQNNITPAAKNLETTDPNQDKDSQAKPEVLEATIAEPSK